MRRLLALAVLLAATLLTCAVAASAADCESCGGGGGGGGGSPATPAPVTDVTFGPSSPTNDSTPTFVYKSDRAGSFFECRYGTPGEAWTAVGAFDCGAVTANVADTRSYTPPSPQADGRYSLFIRACKWYVIDPDLGDEVAICDATPWEYGYVVDTVGPIATVAQGPSSGARVREAPTYTFGGGEAGGSYWCGLEGAPLAQCANPTTVAGVAEEGTYILHYEARDALGNRGQSSGHGFTIDKTAPVVAVSAPTLTRDSTPTWTWTATQDEGDPNIEACLLDGELVACSDGAFTPSAPLADGDHTLEVRVADEAGNFEPKERAVTIDTVAPTLAAPVWDAATKRVTFAPPAGATVTCRLDDAAFAACGSPFDASALAPGAHTYAVRAVDPAGNPVERSVSFTIPGPPQDDKKPAGDGGTGGTGGGSAPVTQASPAGTAPLPAQAGVTPKAPMKTTAKKAGKKSSCAALKKAKTKKARARAKAKCKKAAKKLAAKKGAGKGR